MRLRLFLLILILFSLFVMPSAGETEETVYPLLPGITVIPGDSLFDDPLYVVKFTEPVFSLPAETKPAVKVIAVFIGIIITLVGLFTSDRITRLHFRKKLSEDPNSRPIEILMYIREHPGTTQTEIVNATGFSRGSVAYCLRRLQQENRVSKIAALYYSSDMRPAETEAKAGKVLENAQRKRIFQIIEEHPGISRKELSKDMQMTVSTLRWHLGKMTKAHLILEEVKQHTACYFVHPEFAGKKE